MYDLYEYSDKENDLNLSIKFEKSAPNLQAKKASMVKLLERALVDLRRDTE